MPYFLQVLLPYLGIPVVLGLVKYVWSTDRAALMHRIETLEERAKTCVSELETRQIIDDKVSATLNHIDSDIKDIKESVRNLFLLYVEHPPGKSEDDKK